MIDLHQLRMWRYYFLDLPMFSCGIRSPTAEKRLRRLFEQEMDFMKQGFLTLCDYLGKIPCESEIASFIEKTFWVKIVRESDAYTSLRMSTNKSSEYFRVEGIGNLASVVDGIRPIIILTGHIGSFFIPAIAFSHLGFNVYPIARTVDTSPATPRSAQYYQKLNYKLSEMRFSSKYIYTNFSGKINREIVSLSRKGGIFWAAIDFPRRLYSYKRYPVRFFGKPSSLPSGIIPWGIRKNAIFLTAWNTIENIDNRIFYRHLTIDKPILGTLDTASILQTYADRLSDRITEQPWQWLALQIIQQYDESGGQNI